MTLENLVKNLIENALAEDLPQGDLTTNSLELESRLGRAKLVAKQDLILSGHWLFQNVVESLDPNSQIQWHFTDSDYVLKGQTLASIKADLVQLLQAERVALNFLGRLSGISSLTHQFVEKTQGTHCKILDTRKTTPGWRALEKKAVVDGGGFNHRFNLSDAILIKENHIRMVGGITEAVGRIRRHSNKPIEVETTCLEEVREAVSLNVDRILLDNMDLETMREAISIIGPNIMIEASGNMSLDRIQAVAQLGVHFISIGALTHSAPCTDISLLFDWENK